MARSANRLAFGVDGPAGSGAGGAADSMGTDTVTRPAGTAERRITFNGKIYGAVADLCSDPNTNKIGDRQQKHQNEIRSRVDLVNIPLHIETLARPSQDLINARNE